MQIQVTGKKVELGEALKSRIIDDLSAGIIKYFDRGGTAEVTVSKQGHQFRVDCWVRLASGQILISHAEDVDAHLAFDSSLDHLEKRIRRYKRRLKNHKGPLNGHARDELIPVTVLSPSDKDEEWDEDIVSDHEGPPHALIIAETEANLRTLSVSEAVAEMDLSNYPVLVFRNAAHQGLSVIYRRPDGNIGWIDPQRTIKK
jgi:ribosomal subunit interface protein